MRRNHALALLVLCATTGLSCASANRDEELLRELASLDKEAIFARGEALFEKEDFDDARRYFSFVYDTFPNDPLGHKAALRIADTHAARRDGASQTEARLRYRDFANRYPNDPDRDYALLMLGQTSTGMRLKPDRDLQPVEEAMSAYRQLVSLYPDSPHAAEARERMALLRELLAEHEWLVAEYYARNRRWQGTKARLDYLKENYPEYSRMDQVDALLAKADDEIKAIGEWFAEQQEKAKQAQPR